METWPQKVKNFASLVIRAFTSTKPLKTKWCASVHDKRNCQNLVKSAYQSDECCVVLQEPINKKYIVVLVDAGEHQVG